MANLNLVYSSSVAPEVAPEGDRRSQVHPSSMIPAKREFSQLGDPVRALRILDGWVAGLITLDDGRRQVVDLFLPGELLAPRSTQAFWHMSLLTLTPVRVTHSPGNVDHDRQHFLSHVYHTNAIVRLGCLTAYERLGHLFLEIDERLRSPGQNSPTHIDFPLTQELLGELLGLSAVHINRTLQQLRRDGLIVLKGGILQLLDRAALAEVCHFVSARQAVANPLPG